MDEQKPEAQAKATPSPSSTSGDSSRRPNRGGHRQGGRDHRPLEKKKSQPPPARGKTRHLNAALADGSYIAFDIETTGGNPEKNGITEIFALRYKDGQIHDTFYSMVNPGVPIPPIVRRMTGITDKMVRDAPPIKAIMPDFIRFIADDVLVSHNTIGDMKFLRYFASTECSHEIENYFLCTHLLVEKLAPTAPDKSLKGLATHFALPGDARLHRAEADAYLTLELFKILLRKMQEKKIPTIADGIRFQGDFESGMRLGIGVKSEVLKNLPDAPGVFYLKDYSGHVTFLSSAHSVSREVKRLQKLNALPKQLLRSVLSSSDIETKLTETPFAAALQEATDLEEHRVRFDPTSWHQRTANFVYVATDAEGHRLSTGPLVEGVTAFLGPIRGGKEVTLLLEHISNAVERKPSKKGLKLTPEEASVIEGFLLRRSLKSSFKEKLLKLLPKHSERIHNLGRLRSQLKSVSIPGDLFDGRIMSGLMAVKIEAGWHLYAISDGRLIKEDVVTGDLTAALREGKRHEQFYREILARKVKVSPDGNAVPAQPLKALEANLMNRLFWWGFFGARHENVKIIHVEELARWS